MENNDKKKDIVIVILIIIILLLIGLLYVKVLSKKENALDDQNKNNQTQIIPSPQQEQEKEIVADEKLKTNYEIITQINGMNEYWLEGLFENNIYNLSHKSKTILALEWNSKKNRKIITEDIKKKIDKNYLSSDGQNQFIEEDGTVSLPFKELYYLEDKDVKIIYDNIFNESYDSINHTDIDSCPTYYYDSKNKVYYEVPNCGGTPGLSNVFNYAYKYTNIGNNYYVYTAATRSEYDTNNSNIINIYKSQSKKDIYVSYNENNNAEIDEYTKFKIDSTNYNEFDHYKFMFEKNSEGNYIFKSVEKISV